MWINNLSVDALRRRERARNTRDTRAVLVVRVEHQRQVVAACCGRAGRTGARPGLPAAEARALFTPGQVRLVEEDPTRDAATLRGIGLWAHRFSPLVALDGADGLLVDVSGCGPVFGGEEKLLEGLMSGLKRLGFGARAAIAPTFACAWALARFGASERAIVGDGGQRAAMADLPVAALGVEAEIVRTLAEVGVERVGEVLTLPRSLLPARFGGELPLRIDRALGHAIETIEPMRPIDPVSSERVFDGPTTRMDAIEHAVRTVLDEIAEGLTRRGHGAMRVDLELGRSDLEPARVSIVLSRPSHEASHLWALVRPKIERVHLGFGVERVLGVVSRSGPSVHEQAERWRSGERRPDAEVEREGGRVLDTLVNRLGRGRVSRAELIASHSPERAFAMRCVLDSVGGAHERASGDRPTVVFERPIPVAVTALTPDGPVHRVRLGGVEHEVVCSIGPERIAPVWWVDDASTRDERDYFRVQLAGGAWVWICGVGDRWVLHGAW